jgi:hypothetical protein
MTPRGLDPEDFMAGRRFHGSPEDEPEPPLDGPQCPAVSSGFLVVAYCELEEGHDGPHRATRADGSVCEWGSRVDYPSHRRRAA